MVEMLDGDVFIEYNLEKNFLVVCQQDEYDNRVKT